MLRRYPLLRSVAVAIAFTLSGCGTGQPERSLTRAEADRFEAAFRQAKLTAAVQRKWARSCALCHVNGEGGAPVIGDAVAWAPRLEQGKAMLMKSTLEGFNRMPPLGYCMDCNMEDFAAMIEMMAGTDR